MMNRVEMNEEMMKEVNGGTSSDNVYAKPSAKYYHAHKGCGGEILTKEIHYTTGTQDIYVCSKCGEKHKKYSDFETEFIFVKI